MKLIDILRSAKKPTYVLCWRVDDERGTAAAVPGTIVATCCGCDAKVYLSPDSPLDLRPICGRCLPAASVADLFGRPFGKSEADA